MPRQEEADQLLGEVPTRDQPRLPSQVSTAGSFRLAAGALLVLAALAAACCAAYLRTPSASSMRGSAIADPVGLLECHTAVEGERCYETIIWHQTNPGGALKHPEWSTGLHEDSTVEDIQTWLHKEQRTCPRPCPRMENKLQHGNKSHEKEQGNSTAGGEAGGSRDCHTAVEGEKCHGVVRAAMTEISTQPALYSGLDSSSPFSEFQAVLHGMGLGDCPRPCPGNASARAGANGSANASANVSDGPRGVEPVGGNAVPLRRNESQEAVAWACHTAVEGEQCYQGLVDAMLDDVFENSHKYKGLTAASKLEDFQAYLHTEQQHECPHPCLPCHTAVPGELCHELVMQVMNSSDGDHETFESAQERLQHKGCPKPCAPRPLGTPSLFCFAVVRPHTEEVTTVETQMEWHVGIAACDGFAVLSTSPLVLGRGRNRAEAITFQAASVGTSSSGTAGNTELFINAWAALLRDERFLKYDWTIKVDPDAILFPNRLRKHLVSYNGWNTYVNNCNHFGGSDLFGAIEAFSRSAVEGYYNDIKGPSRCRNELWWQEWGEDVFISKCLDLLGTTAVDDFQLVSDDRCNGVNCHDPWPAAFHPFKTNASWTLCLRQAMGP